MGDNYNAEAGFVPRTGFFRINPDLGYNIFPDNGAFTRHEITGEIEYFWDKERNTDRLWGVNYIGSMFNTGRLSGSLQRVYTYLFEPFDPTGTDQMPLAEGEGYTYHLLQASYRSDARKLLSYVLRGSIGEYFDGERYNVGTEFNYRFQPFVSLGLNLNYNRIILPDPFATANLFLFGSRMDITLTKRIFFTNFVQYNSQFENININARFQYRFAPVSDLFIVYTDNYNTIDFAPEGTLNPVNRALILKLTYWLNL